MITFPSPVQVRMISYPATATVEIAITPEGMVATVDVEVLAADTTIPTPVDFGNNFINGKITFKNITINNGDTLITTTRITSILHGSPQKVSVDHVVNSEPPQSLSSTLATGEAEKYYAEFIFA